MAVLEVLTVGAPWPPSQTMLGLDLSNYLMSEETVTSLAIPNLTELVIADFGGHVHPDRIVPYTYRLFVFDRVSEKMSVQL